MDNFFIEHRDPIFGIIIFIFSGLIIAIFSYLWGVFSKKDDKSKIENFVKRFNSKKGISTKYKELLRSGEIGNDALSILANVFSKSGDFENAINVYLITLENIKDKKEQIFILTELGKIYFNAGFLKKAEEVLLKSVELSPRNETALKYLSVIYERLKMFDRELIVLDALKEQGVDINKSWEFVNAQIIANDTTLSFDKKIKTISKFDSHQISRFIFELYIQNKEPLLKIKKFPQLKDAIDLLWRLDEAVNLKDPEYKALFYAKNLTDKYEKSSFFEIEAISMMRNSGYFLADLNFKYICTECKNSLPSFFYRCPICYSLKEIKIVPRITRKDNEIDMPF
ncbi:MAG: hypothetical protein GXZ15_05785 [Campylobacter sp.]|nr:hypothetical protein [Campylobacter sp.]